MRWTKKADRWGLGSYRFVGKRNNCKIEIIYDSRDRYYFFYIYHLKQGNRYFSYYDDLTYQTEQECIAGAIGYLESINYWRPVKRRAYTIAKKEDEIKTLKQMAEYLANHPCEVISTASNDAERIYTVADDEKKCDNCKFYEVLEEGEYSIGVCKKDRLKYTPRYVETYGWMVCPKFEK